MIQTHIAVIIGSLLFLLGLTWGIYFEYWFIKLQNSIASQKTERTAMEEQLTRQRHTENTVAAFEAAGMISTSEIYRLAEQVHQNNLVMDYVMGSLKRQAEILTVARKDPRAYPVDEPTDRRPPSPVR